MELGDPFQIRLAVVHLKWLDSLRSGAITTRAQALRHVLDEAMHQDLCGQQPRIRRTKAEPRA